MIPPAATEIFALDQVEITVEPWSWQFAATRREEIDAHFARLRRERPALWNGHVLLLNRYAICDGVLRGACFEADFASFCAWRDWNFPDASVCNVFAAAALTSADGAYVLGKMAPFTANAGAVYFPCGTPDPEDVSAGGALDLAGSLNRELTEETGLDIGKLQAEPGWTAVRDRGQLALMKRLTAPQRAEELRASILTHLGGYAQPEFCEIRIVRGPADLDPVMPLFVVAYLEAIWRQ